LGFGLVITSGDDRAPLQDGLVNRLVEARVEMELSKPTRFALRFEDDLCADEPALGDVPELAANTRIGLFALAGDVLECLVYGPVTEVRSAAVLGGPGSWVEVHGEDRRVEMGRVGVQATYSGRASDAVALILQAYEFEPSTQQTLIQYDTDKNQLTQRATDLAFVEDLARRNNMEFWISYEAARAPLSPSIDLTETANFRTSPRRPQPGDVPQVPSLTAPPDRVLKVNPPRGDCPTVNRFEAKVNHEKPAAARGFAMTSSEDQAVVEQIVKSTEPVDPGKVLPIAGVKREVIPPPTANEQESFLSKEAIVNEQSWFVEVDCSTTLEQAGFLVRPHQIVQVAHAGDRLSGAYQVMKALHVITSSDHFIDPVLRANGLGQPA